MPDDKKKYIKPPTADSWRLDVSPLAYNYDNYLNSLGYRAGISSGNALHKVSKGGLYYPMSLNFTQSYSDNSRAYNKNPEKFENPQEVIMHRTFGQPNVYEDFTRGPREANMGVEFKAGATTLSPGPDWSGPVANFDLGLGYSKLRQLYGNAELGGGYKFKDTEGFGGSAGASLKAILQNRDSYGTLQDRIVPGHQEPLIGYEGQNKAAWQYGVHGDIHYNHPHDYWSVGARGDAMLDMLQGKKNYRFADQSTSEHVSATPVINAEIYAKYPLKYGYNKIQNKLEAAKKADKNIDKEISTPKLGGISGRKEEDYRPVEFGTHPISFGMGEEYPIRYKGDNGTHSLFGNIIMPGDSREFKNGGQFNRNFNLPEDSFRQGGNNLHDSIYSSSLEQYPAVYAKGGHMNFKSNAAYKAWLGYGHATGAFEKTPGNQAVSIQGHPHNVQHQMGGFLGNPYVNMFDNGGDLNVPTPASMANMSVAERTALIYQAVNQYVNQARAEGRLGPNDNLNVDGVVAQILLETGNATSSLVKRANNFGGIKADDKWTGPRTGEYRLYATPEEGLKAQIDFYIDNARYRKNGVFEATTPEEHLAAVKRAGYATAPNYVSAGMSMVNSIPKRLAKVDMTKYQIPEATTTVDPEEFTQGKEPINTLGFRHLKPIDIPMDINNTPQIVPYTASASAENQMPDLSSEAPSIPKGWFGGGNTIFGGNRQKKFAEGGPMNQLTEFNEGGSHEENPLGGIPQGMNQNGGMNLVQEGETKNNAQDFIYSDDITISKSIAKQFNLNSRFVGKTYAEASKKANRSDSRRETDTIEQKAAEKDLNKLAEAQETQKQQELEKDMAKMAEKHPEFMAQMMQAQQAPQPGMQGPSPEEMAMMQQQGQMDPSMQGQPMDPAMMEQMQMQQGMRYGGPMSYKCGGNMYDFGGFMKENDDAFTQAGAGALKGAGTGASMGSVIGPWGTAAGAIIGGVVGGISGGIKGHKQDEAEYQAKIDAANQERLTGIQTDIPQEASNHTLEVLGQAALQGGQDMLGAFTPTTVAKRDGGPMGQPLTNLYPWGGGLNRYAVDYSKFQGNDLGNPYAVAQRNTLPTSFNYNGNMDALPADFGNYQAPEILGENNKGLVLNNDGTALTGSGNAYDWNTGNMPSIDNPQSYSNSNSSLDNSTSKKVSSNENKNQFSDFKTEQDAMQDKFSMNETAGQFIGSNLGTAYNIYQGLFGKKAKVPTAKDLFTPIEAYRQNVNPQLRAAEEAYAGAVRGIMNAAPGAGAYLTNRAMLAKDQVAAKAGILAQAENAYNQNKQQVDMFNNQNRSQATLKAFELKSAIDAAKQNYLQAGLEGMGQKTNADKANLAALIYANMHGGGEYGVEANPYLKQMTMNYQKRRKAKNS